MKLLYRKDHNLEVTAVIGMVLLVFLLILNLFCSVPLILNVSVCLLGAFSIAFLYIKYFTHLFLFHGRVKDIIAIVNEVIESEEEFIRINSDVHFNNVAKLNHNIISIKAFKKGLLIQPFLCIPCAIHKNEIISIEAYESDIIQIHHNSKFMSSPMILKGDNRILYDKLRDLYSYC